MTEKTMVEDEFILISASVVLLIFSVTLEGVSKRNEPSPGIYTTFAPEKENEIYGIYNTYLG